MVNKAIYTHIYIYIYIYIWEKNSTLLAYVFCEHTDVAMIQSVMLNSTFDCHHELMVTAS